MARSISRQPSSSTAQSSAPARAGRAPAKQENAQYGGATVDQLTPVLDEPGVSANLGTRPAIVLTDTNTVTEEEQAKNAEVAVQVQRYIVEADREVGINGHRCKLRTGKILDSLNYDIRKLQQQGVKLKAYVEA